jgi:transcriptional regulator with XRE-family HTH domain
VTILRQAVGETLRALRLRQQRTLRDVSERARVSLGYLSEVERGQKEPSSELLASICGALEVSLSDVLREVSDSLRKQERASEVARIGATAVRGPVSRRAGSGETSVRSASGFAA